MYTYMYHMHVRVGSVMGGHNICQRVFKLHLSMGIQTGQGTLTLASTAFNTKCLRANKDQLYYKVNKSC
jgi:hypothetical protein